MNTPSVTGTRRNMDNSRKKGLCCRVKPGLSVLLPFSLLCLILSVSCKDEPLHEDPSAKLVFSVDTVFFDTIFTDIGSATRHFKVYNPYDRSLEITSINLAGTGETPYRLNVDGIAGSSFRNIVLRGRDSMFVFVETTIDPLNENSPMVITDSIVFSTNGNLQDVKLVAWGQDVNIINGEIFETTTFQAGKPYLVYNSMLVDTGHVLTIEPGVRMHFHKNSRLYVLGSIIAEGTGEMPVIFEGARTETVYRNIPGQWDGIWLMAGSSDNRFVNTVIKNATVGILADSVVTGNPTLYLSNSRIENMTFAGIFARGAEIYSYNTIVSNCGYFAVALTIGGDYTFYHCTIANYWNFGGRRTPSVIIENYYKDVDNRVQTRPVRAVFGNSIIHGSQGKEIGFSIDSTTLFDVTFSYSLLPLLNDHYSEFPQIFQNCIKHANPGFVDRANRNFRLIDDSPAVDAGDPVTGNLFPFDFDGNSRISDTAPDIGAFEWTEVVAEPDNE